MGAGINKVFKDIDNKIKKHLSVSDETKAKADLKAKILYYNKFRKPKKD